MSDSGEGKSEEEVCGICLYSSNGEVISRGYIDSCDHYFCFVCILEWSKIESKCPICKRRFSHIRRPPKPGVFPKQRILPVPIRDQVYGHVPPNLYSDAKCSVCDSGSDESFLLLCDLCDVPSHSYCIGLGATVPEGDWFCRDCAVLKAEHINDEAHNHISSVPSRTLIGESSVLNARTLLRCRNVHDRIRVLRANWNNIRNGSSSFTTTLQKPVIGSSSGGTEPSIAHGGASNMSHRSSSHEINKAWKMMDLAMTIGRDRKRSTPQTSNSPLKKINSSKDVASHPLSVSPNFSNKDTGSVTPQQDHSLANQNRHAPQILERRSKSCERKIFAVPGAMSTKEVDCLPRNDAYKGKTGISLDRFLSRSPLTAKSEVGVSCNSSTISPFIAAVVPHVNPQCDTSPSPDRRCYLSYRDVVDKKCCKGKHVNSENDAKSEIQSLVKLNLKILTKDHKLEDDEFKQVARTATYSIVAACELQHPKPGCEHFPSSICCHTNDIHQQRRSSLMRNSCRECFYAFVKDVVSNLLNDKRIYRDKS